jgi:hypothetical protein
VAEEFSCAQGSTSGIERLALREVVTLIPDRLKVSMHTRELERRIRAMGSNPTLRQMSVILLIDSGRFRFIPEVHRAAAF